MLMSPKEVPLVMTPWESQLQHHQVDPMLQEIQGDEAIKMIEQLNISGQPGAAEALLTQNAARTAYEQHRARPNMLTRFLDRVLS
jgi:hypothetical protein